MEEVELLVHTQGADSAMIASVFEGSTDGRKSGDLMGESRAPSELFEGATPGLDALRDLLRGIALDADERHLSMSTSVDRLRSRTGSSRGIHRSTPKSWTGSPTVDDVRPDKIRIGSIKKYL